MGVQFKVQPKGGKRPSCCSWRTCRPLENQHTRAQDILANGATTRKQKLWCTCLVLESWSWTRHLGGNPENILKSCCQVETIAGSCLDFLFSQVGSTEINVDTSLCVPVDTFSSLFCTCITTYFLIRSLVLE